MKDLISGATPTNRSMEYEYMGPDELRNHLQAEMKKIKEVADEAGMTK